MSFRGQYSVDNRLIPTEMQTLGGLYTDEMTMRALDTAMEQHDVSRLQIINGMIKWGFTVGSPVTQVRNVWSNTLALMAGGNMFLGRGTGLLKGMRVAATGLGITDLKAVTEDGKARRELFREAIRYGVPIGQNADIGDLKF